MNLFQILIVDDQRLFAECLAGILTGLGEGWLGEVRIAGRTPTPDKRVASPPISCQAPLPYPHARARCGRGLSRVLRYQYKSYPSYD